MDTSHHLTNHHSHQCNSGRIYLSQDCESVRQIKYFWLQKLEGLSPQIQVLLNHDYDHEQSMLPPRNPNQTENFQINTRPTKAVILTAP